MSPWQVITICTILLRRAAQICPPICLRGTVSQFLHSHNPFKIPACGGLFSPLWEKFSAKSCLWEKFWPDTPHPRRGASVELSEGESDPSQTYVSPFRIPVRRSAVDKDCRVRLSAGKNSLARRFCWNLVILLVSSLRERHPKSPVSRCSNYTLPQCVLSLKQLITHFPHLTSAFDNAL